MCLQQQIRWLTRWWLFVAKFLPFHWTVYQLKYTRSTLTDTPLKSVNWRCLTSSKFGNTENTTKNIGDTLHVAPSKNSQLFDLNGVVICTIQRFGMILTQVPNKSLLHCYYSQCFNQWIRLAVGVMFSSIIQYWRCRLKPLMVIFTHFHCVDSLSKVQASDFSNFPVAVCDWSVCGHAAAKHSRIACS